MREPARIFFSLHRTTEKDDAQARLSALRRRLRTGGKVLGVIQALGRLLGTTSARTAQARNTELAIASMGKTVRSSAKNVAGIRVAPGTERWQKPRSTQIDAAVGREGYRCSQTST